MDPEDNPEVDSLLADVMENRVFAPDNIPQHRKPSNARTAFIDPSFFEREKYANWLLPYYDKYFARAGYDESERYFNDEARVEKLVLNNHVKAFIGFTDTSVVGFWGEDIGYYYHVGDLEVKFDSNSNHITYFHINEHQIFGPDSYRTYEIKGEGVPIPYHRFRDDYCVFGSDVKSCIGTDFYYLEVPDENSSRTLISYECDGTSVIAIRLSWQ